MSVQSWAVSRRDGLGFRFGILFSPLTLVEALAAIRPAVRRMDGILLVRQRAAAGGARFFVPDCIQINTLRAARLVGHVEDGSRGSWIALDTERMLGRRSRRICREINLPV